MTNKSQPLSTWQYLWRLIKYRPWLYLADVLVWIVFLFMWMVPGVISKLFLDLLSGEAPLRFGVWGIVALAMGSAVGNVVVILAGIILDAYHRFFLMALLSRNLLAHILQRPGAWAIPGSAGEAFYIVNQVSCNIIGIALELFEGIKAGIMERNTGSTVQYGFQVFNFTGFKLF